LGLPLLVFYGLGVTVGAGIFALVGEIAGMAGDLAPLAFVLASVLAAASAGSYAMLSVRFPRAAGAAVYATAGFGSSIGRWTGLGVAATGIISSAVIALAFGSYVSTLVGFPEWLIALSLVVIAALVASIGIRESVLVAAGVTILEVGTLIVILLAGGPELGNSEMWTRVVSVPGDWAALGIVLSAAVVAFYAFIGFEDIVNLAEETVRPERVLGPAIFITLGLTTLLYVGVSVLSVAVSDRVSLAESDAPMGDLFAALTGGSPTVIAAIASIALVNGVLIQFLMASRVLYGMARDGALPAKWLGRLHPTRQTPINATLLIATIVGVLIVALPIVSLAELTSYVTLSVFIVVNLSLFRVMLRSDERGSGWRGAWGLTAAMLSGGVLVGDLISRISS